MINLLDLELFLSSSSAFHDGSSLSFFSVLIERLEEQIDEINNEKNMFDQTEFLYLLNRLRHSTYLLLMMSRTCSCQYEENLFFLLLFLQLPLEDDEIQQGMCVWWADRITLLFSSPAFSLSIDTISSFERRATLSICMQIVSWHQLLDKTIILLDDNRTIINEAIWWHSSAWQKR